MVLQLGLLDNHTPNWCPGSSAIGGTCSAKFLRLETYFIVRFRSKAKLWTVDIDKQLENPNPRLTSPSVVMTRRRATPSVRPRELLSTVNGTKEMKLKKNHSRQRS